MKPEIRNALLCKKESHSSYYSLESAIQFNDSESSIDSFTLDYEIPKIDIRKEARLKRECKKDEQAKIDKYWERIKAVKDAEELLRDHFAAIEEKEYIINQITSRTKYT